MFSTISLPAPLSWLNCAIACAMTRSLFSPYLAKTGGAAATMPSTSPGTLLLPFGHIACMISSVNIIHVALRFRLCMMNRSTLRTLTLGCAARLHQGKTTRRHAIFEQPLALAEDQREDPDAKLVDQFCGDQRLKQFAAAPDVQFGPVGCLQPADLVNGVAADGLRVHPVEPVEAVRDDEFRRLGEGLRDGIVAGIRPVRREYFIGAAP